MNRSFIALSCLFAATSFAGPGDLDGSFDPSPGANAAIRAVALQPDGKIVIVGDFTTAGGQPRMRVARLMPNGALDTTFVSTAGPDRGVTAVALQSDGKILLTGDFNNVAGAARKYFARLNADGTHDTTFASTQPFLASGTMRTIQSLPDGKVLMSGGQIFFTISLNRAGVMRANANGTGDATFTPPAFTGTVFSAFSEPGGNIIVGGAFTVSGEVTRNSIVRLNSSGALDTTFTPSDFPATLSGFVRSVLPAANGKYIAIGNGAGASACVRFQANGLVDPTYTPASADGSILAHAIGPDGAVIIAGDFGMVNGAQRLGVARLTPNGALDTAFNVGEGAGTSVYSVTIQPNSQVLVAGAFPGFNGVYIGPIVRLHGGLFLGAPTFVGGVFAFDAFTALGHTYTLQYKTDLAQIDWTSAAPVNGTGAVHHFTDNTGGAPIRLYRILEN